MDLHKKVDVANILKIIMFYFNLKGYMIYNKY